MAKLNISENQLSIDCDCGAVHTVIKDGEEYKLKSKFVKPKKEERKPDEQTEKKDFLADLYGTEQE